jgi:hypothetical protein
MKITFENMRGQAISGGIDNRPPAYGARNTGADSWSLPSQSIVTNPLLPRSEFAQALFDVFKIVCAFLLVSATGIGIAFSFFILLFVQT